MGDSQSNYEELLKAMPEMAKAVNAFEGERTKRDALRALLRAKSGMAAVDISRNTEERKRAQKRVTTKKKAAGDSTTQKKTNKKKSGPSVIGDLNLKPKNETSFKEFAEEKAPKTYQEQSVTAVFYLQDELGLTDVSADHVYSCYREMKWRSPSDFVNHLQVLSSTKKWIDTSDMNAITVTTVGENVVRHDLPKGTDS